LGEHLYSEFVAHDVDGAMDTMVPDACVNHVPTMTGGMGHDEVNAFTISFRQRPSTDIEIIPVSRTVGTDSIVDEMVVKFTHTCVIDHLLPGIPPTGRPVEIPVVGVVQFRDGQVLRASISTGISFGIGADAETGPSRSPHRRCRDRAQGSGQDATE